MWGGVKYTDGGGEQQVWRVVPESWGASGIGTVAFGTLAGAGGAALAKGNIWAGAATGFVVSLLNHVAHENGWFDEQDNKPKNVTLKSLGVNDTETSENIIKKILENMKNGETIDGKSFSFIDNDIGDYVLTIKRIDGNNFEITTKGLLTGSALKNKSTISIKIAKLKIDGIINDAYKVTLNGLTKLGRTLIYEQVFINDNKRFMMQIDGTMTSSKIKDLA